MAQMVAQLDALNLANAGAQVRGCCSLCARARSVMCLRFLAKLSTCSRPPRSSHRPPPASSRCRCRPSRRRRCRERRPGPQRTATRSLFGLLLLCASACGVARAPSLPLLTRRATAGLRMPAVDVLLRPGGLGLAPQRPQASAGALSKQRESMRVPWALIPCSSQARWWFGRDSLISALWCSAPPSDAACCRRRARPLRLFQTMPTTTTRRYRDQMRRRTRSWPAATRRRKRRLHRRT